MNVVPMQQPILSRRPPLSVSPDDILDMAVNMVGTVTVYVTVPVAQALLSMNTGNRPIIEKWVKTLAGRMRRGAWMLTGETVIVSSEGILNDGQHRLHAVVESGVTVPMDIRFGIERAAFPVSGTSKARTPGQMLSIAGHPSALRLASAAGILVRYARYQAGRTPTYALRSEVGHDQIKRFVDLSPELAGSVRVMSNLDFQPLCNGHGIVAHYLSTLHDLEAASEFWDVVRHGMTNDARSPARQLRERLMRDAMSKAKLPDDERFALTLKAWLAWKSGKGISGLAFRSSGEGAEAFPKIPVVLPDVG